ncbi:MAG: hypothetical protein WC959_06825 [Kiritimatiellales bacterium]
MSVSKKTDNTGWILDAAIPLPRIDGRKHREWNILIARQNYDQSLGKKTRELSSFPRLSSPDFHLLNEYFRAF